MREWCVWVCGLLLRFNTKFQHHDQAKVAAFSGITKIGRTHTQVARMRRHFKIFICVELVIFDLALLQASLLFAAKEFFLFLCYLFFRMPLLLLWVKSFLATLVR